MIPFSLSIIPSWAPANETPFVFLSSSSPYSLLAIRQAIAWYNAHLAQSASPSSSAVVAPRTKQQQQQQQVPPQVVLISDDADNLAKAKKAGLEAYSGAFSFTFGSF